jgi:asparagine synthase (glutamine-hydrolysing)
MCGIAGTIRFRGVVDADLLVRQRDTMSHRGPDSSGVWLSSDGKVGLAHRRLAIIDLSPAGHQPMIDRETGSAITFNGEIYNYVELRDRLRASGHHFATQSDTEVILAAYREWGLDCVRELGGMFAFALYDPTRRRVLLARDRAGEKPLFFRVTPDEFTFASEAKALLADPSCPRRVRAQSLNEYLAYGYVTGSHTMFADLHRILPGGRAVVDVDAGTVTHDRYWQLPKSAVTSASATPDELVDELHGLLKAAVQRQLVADVPVGILLSGGVDSSLVTAIAAETSSKPVRTFTARFPGHAGFDEGPFARLVAEHVGAEHVELETQPADASLLTRLVEQFDDPISDSSMIPTFLVSQEIRRHATVALGGDGGDELFGGYSRYPVQIRHERIRRRVPAFARSAAATAAAHLLPEGVPGRGFLSALAGDAGTSIANAGRVFRDDERAKLSDPLRALGATALGAPEFARVHAMADRSTTLQRATAVDFSTYMVDDVLVKVDRASMLTSLEVRAPFLDGAVTDFAFSRLPDAMRATEHGRKLILRRLGARLLPDTLDLKRKQGFSIPMDEWLRGAWRPLLDAACADNSGSLVSSNALTAYRDYFDRGRPVGDRLFTLMFLKLWERHYRITDVI